jgi:hypothetical protein
MVPHQNIRNLMLNDEVAAAVRAGQFHLWAVEDIDQGLEVLTGRPAGQADADGNFPEGTVNYLVARRLGELGDRLRRFGPPRPERDGQAREETAEKEPEPDPATPAGDPPAPA